MEVIYGLIPSMIIIGLIAVVILFWAIKSGQFDDLEGDAQRILMDEDLTLPNKKVSEQESTSPEDKSEENYTNEADKNTKKD